MSKAIIVSDIHGEPSVLEKILRIAEERNASAILCAGDLGLYNAQMCSLLLTRKVPFLCVCGNCDSPFDFALAGLPEASVYLCTSVNGHDVFLTHGHRASRPEDAGLVTEEGSIIVTGHTHRPSLGKEGSIVYLNPGSAARPRTSEGPTYAQIEEDCVRLISLDTGKTLKKVSFNA